MTGAPSGDYVERLKHRTKYTVLLDIKTEGGLERSKHIKQDKAGREHEIHSKLGGFSHAQIQRNIERSLVLI